MTITLVGTPQRRANWTLFLVICDGVEVYLPLQEFRALRNMAERHPQPTKLDPYTTEYKDVWKARKRFEAQEVYPVISAGVRLWKLNCNNPVIADSAWLVDKKEENP